MKNLIKKAFYTTTWFTIATTTNLTNAIDFGPQNVKWTVVGTQKTADSALQDLLAWLMGFLALIAFLFLIWWGFQFLTAGGDEEKVKKGKTIIIQSLLGLFVIWIAWGLVSWLIQGLTTAS